jgi:uncharacterized protein (TIGR02231 family)
MKMKSFGVLLWAFFLVVFVQAQQADEQKLTANLTHVTVFLNRAQLTHITKATVNAGVTQLTIEGLPAGLDRQSLQVSGKGEVVILSVKSNVNYLNTQTKSLPIRQLEDSLQTQWNELNGFNSLKETLGKEQEMILANQAIGGQQTGITVERLQQMADFFRSRLTDIKTRLFKNEYNIVKANQHINQLQNQLNELNAKRKQPTAEVLVSLSAKSRVQVELEINYLIDDAGWNPVYDLRAKDTRSPLQLSYKANVHQQSGLDWNKVRLTLSTTNPAVGGASPTLEPQWVEIERPAPKGKMVIKYLPPVITQEEMPEEVTASDDEPKMGNAGFFEPAAETIADYTTVTESSISVAFDIALPYTVLSGGTPQLVDITANDLPASYHHFCVPKLDADAFLMADVMGWEKYNLLSGNANIYFEGTFVGESFLDVNNTKDTLSLSLGRDKKVVVKRDKITDFSSRKTIGRNVVETVAFRITVRNTKKEPLQITLEDQVPVSKDSQVEVEVLEAKGAEQHQETGKLTWKLNLAAAETQTLELKYTVKYPKGKTVDGL